VDRVDFRERIPVGALVVCDAAVNYVGNSSMHITVEVYAEKVSTGERRHTHTAHTVFVAIDEFGRPKHVPRLVAETDEEKARYEQARIHAEEMKKHR
jgi:acyl-CoA hydrolase